MTEVSEHAGPMEHAVTEALAARAATGADRRDAATERLAVHYAQLVDDAQPAARYTRPLELIAAACAISDNPEVARAYDTIAAALAEHSVASDLGPKLLAVLDALGLTPKARAATKQTPAGAAPRPANPLDQLRARRAQRTGA